jgi:hypothetical protein
MARDQYTPEQWAQIKRWVDNWKTLGPELERIREEELRNENTIRAFEIFTGMAFLATRNFPPEPTSGLIEQQRRFMELAKKQEQARA